MAQSFLSRLLALTALALPVAAVANTTAALFADNAPARSVLQFSAETALGLPVLPLDLVDFHFSPSPTTTEPQWFVPTPDAPAAHDSSLILLGTQVPDGTLAPESISLTARLSTTALAFAELRAHLRRR